jgi:hypothetical protein
MPFVRIDIEELCGGGRARKFVAHVQVEFYQVRCV